MNKQLKVLFVTAEAVPFAKVGGLADVAGALPLALEKLGVDVTLVLPKYKSIDQEKFGITSVAQVSNFTVGLGRRVAEARLYQTTLPGSKVKVYFVANDYYFGRDGIYDDPKTKQGYTDNAERFTFFMKAVLPAAKQLGWKPNVVHCHDHQTALVPAYLKLKYNQDPFFKGIATLFTIHNMAYQGVFDKSIWEVLDFDPGLFYPHSPFEFYGMVNFMKASICYADIITTVSEKYAEEIQTSEEFGWKLEGVLRSRHGDVYGILNGIDYDIWNPEIDKLIPHNYSPKNLAGKRLNKEALLETAKLPILKSNPPLIGIVSRLADQKGFDLLASIIDKILGLGVQMVVLGTGQPEYHKLFERMVEKYPKQMSVFFAFNDRLAHLIEAGSDMFLMPSRYEPCGLNQMYSLKYGTVPIVRATGGLADTIREFDLVSKTGNGFRFYNYVPHELFAAIERAVRLYNTDKEAWQKLMINGMTEDYSWNRSAKKYVELYDKAIAKTIG
jgi:starch synthase